MFIIADLVSLRVGLSLVSLDEGGVTGIMTRGQGTNSNFYVFWVLRCLNRREKSLVYYNDDQQKKFAAKPVSFHTRSANYYNLVFIFFLYALTVFAQNDEVEL